MKFSALGKLGLLNEHLRMVKHQGPKRNHNALEIIAELGSESNAHGLAKIATSRKTKRKVLWALLVIAGFTAATLQLSLLVTKYLQFQVVEVSEMKDGMPVEYPSITICNIAATSMTKTKHLISSNNANLVDWVQFITLASFGEQQARVNSIQAFYENVRKEAEYISHDIKDILVHCRFNQQKCSPNNFTKFFDGKNYYNCYTFNAGNAGKNLLMHATGPQNGLSLIIALDNDPLLGTYGIYNVESNIEHSAGVRVQVHAPNTMPSPVDHGFDVPPGYSTSVGVKSVFHTRLSQPYGNCTNEMLIGEKRYRNTIFSCLSLCKQIIVIEKCGCKASALPDTGNSNVSFCGEIENWREIFFRLFTEGQMATKIPLPNLICEERILKMLANDRGYEKSCRCHQPCKETSYDKSISLSYWPLEFYQLNALEVFYGDNIKGTVLQEAWEHLHELVKKFQPSENFTENQENMMNLSMSLDDRQKQVRASDLIRQSLLRLNIYLEDLSVVEFRQMPAYELADLFADIGGTLGLWMGISVLTIMELMELIIRLIMLLFNSEHRIQDHEDPVANGMLDHDTECDYDRNELDRNIYTKNDYREHIESPV